MYKQKSKLFHLCLSQLGYKLFASNFERQNLSRILRVKTIRDRHYVVFLALLKTLNLLQHSLLFILSLSRFFALLLLL